MASLGQIFNQGDLPESQGYDLIPDGWYDADITKAELKPTKDGSGKFIALSYKISGPTHAGRIVFGNLNIKNRSPEAERIGLQQMGEVMKCIGLNKIEDTDQFVGGSLKIKVGTSKAQEGYEPRNEVKGFKANGSSGPVVDYPPSGTASSGSAPPWAKK